jgi:cobalt/nickel transport system permease protein
LLDISRIDYWANCTISPVHNSSVISKMLATGCLIAAVVISNDIEALLGVYAIVLVTVRAARLPMRTILAISIFPGLFAILYAVSQAGRGLDYPVLIIVKAMTAATAMILLISTTPYAEVVGLLGRAMPRVVYDGLFMTYRSFFILLGLTGNFMTALRLRGGFEPRKVVKNASNMASGVGFLFIRAFDKSQRLYDVMSIRGYSGELGTRRKAGPIEVTDLPFMVASAAVLAFAVIFQGSHFGGGLYIASLVAAYFILTEALRIWKRSSV